MRNRSALWSGLVGAWVCLAACEDSLLKGPLQANEAAVSRPDGSSGKTDAPLDAPWGAEAGKLLDTSAAGDGPRADKPKMKLDQRVFDRAITDKRVVDKRVPDKSIADKVVAVDKPSSDAGCLKPGCVYTGHPLAALRGANVHGEEVTAEDLRVFAQTWKGNMIRWDAGGAAYPDGLTMSNYDQLLQDSLNHLDTLLPYCKQYGLYVLVNLHSLSCGLFTSAAAQTKLVDAWKKIATRYKGNPVVWAYDLANEPTSPASYPAGVQKWNDLAERIALEIRKLDGVKTIVVEAQNWALPSDFNGFRTINVTNVVYSFHFYNPHEFTHQGLGIYAGGVYSYPGMINGEYWDKSTLELAMQPAINWAKNNKVHIFVGEFSAIRWAPNNSGYRWLKDSIELFEKYGWDWAYHSWRFWDGWSAEHTDNQNDPNPGPSDRGTLLKSWLAKNSVPTF